MPEQLLLTPGFNRELGSPAHMQDSGYLPVCVVTDLKGKILIRNMAPVGKREWLVTKAKVSINRFWTASTAVVQCSMEATSLSDYFPALCGDKKILGFKHRGSGQLPPDFQENPGPLRPTDEICIYMGYIESLRPVEQKDIDEDRLLRVFIGPIDTITATGTSRAGTNILIQCRDRMKYLMDSLGTYNTGDSVQTLITALAEDNSTEDVNAPKDDNTAQKKTGLSRVDVVLTLARRAVGDLRDAPSLADKRAECDFVAGVGVDLGEWLDTTMASGAASSAAANTTTSSSSPRDAFNTPQSGNTESTQTPPAAGSATNSPTTSTSDTPAAAAADNTPAPSTSTPTTATTTEDTTQNKPASSPGVVADEASIFALYEGPNTGAKWKGRLAPYTTNKDVEVSRTLKLNILTGRHSYERADITANFQVTDRVPVEYIKYMSMQEPWPTEFFAHHQTGEYWYANRGTDFSGFEDKKRLYRSYYYRRWPEGTVPDIRQMCISFREERSSIGMKTNIIADGGKNDGGNTEAPRVGKVHISSTPEWLVDRVIPASYYVVSDPTASDGVSLAAVALMYARQTSKDLRVATAKLTGDPTFIPGEAVQVAGSPLHSDPVSSDQLKKDKDDAKALLADYQALDKDILIKIKDGTTSSPALVVKPSITKKEVGINIRDAGKGGEDDIKSTRQYCPALYGYPEDEGTRKMVFTSPPNTVWRVEGITHSYNDGEPGYYTELALLSPF